MKKIAIIGAGQLGSRHLQALNLVDLPLKILVVDPDQQALSVAQSRFEATIGQYKHEVTYANSIQDEHSLDVAIVASCAKHRSAIVKSLLAQTSVKYLILEKLLFDLQQDYSDITNLLDNKETKTWVNCPMRMMPFYQEVAHQFDGNSVHYQVHGSQYGLITNAIHYLDHIAHITRDNDFVLDLNYLDKEIIPGKRAGYYEITGTLIAKYAKGSIAILHCDKSGAAPMQIEIFNNKRRVISREWEQKAWEANQDNDWQWKECTAVIPYQSALTAVLINQLINTGTCDLPDFNTSVKTHLQLLKPLNQYLVNCGVIVNSDYFPFT